MNRTVSSVAKLLFLAAAYGIDVSAGQVASFVALVVLLSFSTLANVAADMSVAVVVRRFAG